MYTFELGPIRPPSEAESLLIRSTRNCPWNKCTFCVTYKDKVFSRRSMEDIKQDIIAVKEICNKIIELSFRWGYDGKVNEKMLELIQANNQYHLYHVAHWMYFGSKTVFIQDADSMIMKAEDLAKIIRLIRTTFPGVTRITCYGRSSTISRKSLSDLQLLREAGLNRVHIGMESGCDEVLKFVNKGTSANQHIEAGQMVKAAGLSLSEYIIPGLGGKIWALEHPIDTAKVLNAVNPDFIRLRTLSVVENTPLHEKMQTGEFIPQEEDDVVKELRLLIERLECSATLVSDHSVNLLQEVEGSLSTAKQKMLAAIDCYLAMPSQVRLNFRLGRRTMIYNTLDDLNDTARYKYIEEMLQRISQNENPEAVIASWHRQFIV